MNSTMWSLAISAGGLILSILYQIWARANTQGADKQSMLQLTGQVAKLIDWNDDRIRFQSGTTEFIGNQKEFNGRVNTRLDGHGTDIAKLQGKDELRGGKG